MCSRTQHRAETESPLTSRRAPRSNCCPTGVGSASSGRRALHTEAHWQRMQFRGKDSCRSPLHPADVQEMARSDHPSCPGSPRRGLRYRPADRDRPATREHVAQHMHCSSAADRRLRRDHRPATETPSRPHAPLEAGCRRFHRTSARGSRKLGTAASVRQIPSSDRAHRSRSQNRRRSTWRRHGIGSTTYAPCDREPCTGPRRTGNDRAKLPDDANQCSRRNTGSVTVSVCFSKSTRTGMPIVSSSGGQSTTLLRIRTPSSNSTTTAA